MTETPASKAAERAAASAMLEAAGEDRHPLTRKTDRNEQICRERDEGASYAAIGARHGLSGHRVRNIVLSAKARVAKAQWLRMVGELGAAKKLDGRGANQ